MNINLKRLKNHSKKLITLICTGILFFASCKKTDSNTTSLNWDVKKQEIANKVKTDLANLKAILPYTISRANSGDVSFNNQKITEYYNITGTSTNKITTFSRVKNSSELIANIKSKQLSTLPGEDTPADPVDEEDPYEVLTRDGYRNSYRRATENYTDLASYLIVMNGISETIISTYLLTEDEKVMMYTEIETLKQYATDLETNPDYWMDLYAPSESGTGVSFVKNNSIMSTGGAALGKNIIMGAKPRLGCKIDVRSVLISGVVGGFWAAVGAAKVGAVAGTVTVPGIGTVTGAVSGFMAGFAVGFTGGVVTGVIGSLLYTCGR